MRSGFCVAQWKS